jgi:hypothetical protein
MKKFSLSLLNKFRNGEYLQFMKMVIMIFENSGAGDLLLGDRLKALKAAVEEMERVFQDTTAHELTPELQSLDARRIRAMSGLKRAIGSYQLMEEEEFNKPANALLSNYVFHGNRIEKLTLPQKTASIDALLSDWNTKPALQEAVNTLSLDKWLTRLAAFNREFTEKFVLRNETTVKAPQTGDKKLSIKEAFAELIADTESHARLNKENPAYNKILDRINTLSDKYDVIVKSRPSDKRKNKDRDIQFESFTES